MLGSVPLQNQRQLDPYHRSRPVTHPFANLNTTAGSNEAKKQHAYAIIREEIAFFKAVVAQAEKEIFALKSKFNVLANVHRLPEEILADIFLLLAHDDQPFTSRWINITHVCSYWRKTALSRLEIWSRPDFRNPKYASESVKRAKGYPLTIDFSITDSSRLAVVSQPALRVLSENIPKAKQLILRNCHCLPVSAPSESMIDVTTLLKRPAPLLESLSLNNVPFIVPVTLPENLFSGNIPKLRQISLVNWILPQTKSSLLAFAQITSLKMVFNGADPRQPAADTFLLLKHLPQLQDLYIHNLLRAIPLDAPFNTPFELPRLNQLTVNDSSNGCDVFFRLITYPPTATVEINFTKFSQSDIAMISSPALSTADTRIIKKVGNRLHASICALEIRGVGNRQLCALEAHTYTPWKKLTCQLSLKGVPSLPIRRGRLSDLLPLSNLVSFVYGLSKSSEDLWENIGQLPNLRNLGTHGNHEGFLTILGSDTYFPSLSSLLFGGWKFWGASDRVDENFDTIGPDWFPPPDGHVHIALLTDALLLRWRNKQNLTQITVMNSTFTPEHAAVVKEITAGRTKWSIT